MNHYIVDGRYKDLLEYHHIDVKEVLKYADLPSNLFLTKNIKLKEKQYYRLLEAIDQIGNREGLALLLSTTEDIEQFSPPLFASYCSKNGYMCLKRLSRYKRLIGPMGMEVKENGVIYSAGDPSSELPRFLIESEFVFLIHILRKATKRHIKPLQVITRMPLEDSIDNFIGIKSKMGDENKIIFDPHDLELPFISFNEGMWTYFEPELNRRLEELDQHESISKLVEGALIELLPAGISGIEEVADKLGFSKRTLQRKLQEEKTTYKKELNKTRKILALHYLDHTDLSTNDIAFLLGYEELNSFLRAFNHWMGKSLSSYKLERTQIN